MYMNNNSICVNFVDTKYVFIFSMFRAPCVLEKNYIKILDQPF
jgi:hypothetical protein